MNLFKWLSQNILFAITLFLLAFIPLYPKLPLININHVWVYVRVEDLLVVWALLVWFFQIIRGKASLKTPLTLPIMIFWIIGAIATIHAVVVIFPTISNVFSNVAFLSMLRRIEYLSLFFVAYAGMKDKRFISYVISVLIVTLILVILYGIGQRYLGFPAFLTMNEEFAKGVPIHLSRQSRVPSTFGGHYDLAAYLVLIIPILASLLFAFKNKFIKLFLLATISFGFVLLSMTVSRVSFFVLLISLAFLLLFHLKGFRQEWFVKKKVWFLFSLPLFALIALFLTFKFSHNLLARFGNTVKEVDILVDAKTGGDIGQVKKVSVTKFKDKIILGKTFQTRDDLNIREYSPELASSSAVVPFKHLPPEVIEVIPPDTPTGENLPQGTGYINLSLAPVTKRVADFFYETADPLKAARSPYTTRFYGNFLIKKASAYDLSFTTRFQGEWPHALEAFRRNILLGSGYSSVSLAVDNNYLRILGEVGLLGFAAFFAIFAVLGIYIKRTLPEVTSPVVKSFVVGVSAGVLGLFLNAVLIDIFEASKIAYLLWLLTGVTVGILHLYMTKNIAVYKELKNVVTSRYAVIIYICIAGFVLFAPMLKNYFVGDDFTWLRWVADCKIVTTGSGECPTAYAKIVHYFTQSDGFFYRPGTKIYFLLMYSLFWLNQSVYHIVSIVLHIIITVLVFLLARRVLKDNLLSSLAAFLFLTLSGYSEVVFWVASTGHLFNMMFILASLLFFIAWSDRKREIFYVASFLSLAASLLFHELGIVTPLLIIAYQFVFEEGFRLQKVMKRRYILLFLPIILYLFARLVSGSHWFNGDYSYNLVKLPLNIVGNSIGYFLLALFGPIILPFYQILRNASKVHTLFYAIVFFVVAGIITVMWRRIKKAAVLLIKRMGEEDLRIILFSVLFFVITLIPFLGLGNITSRYSYLASIGVILLFVYFLRKLYGYLLVNGKEIALTSVVTILSVFYLLQIIQVQQNHSDWYEAGKRVEKFFISIDAQYKDHWSQKPMEFHFVNVPIRHGDAWMFPVGLDDALWFILRNPSVRVFQDRSLDEAFNAVSSPLTQKVFEFDENGSVTEMRRVMTTKGFMIEKEE